MLSDRFEDKIMEYPLYRMREIRSFSLTAGSSSDPELLEGCCLIVCYGGNGRLTLDSKMYALKEGAIFIAPSFSLITIRAGEAEQLQMMLAAFNEVGTLSAPMARFPYEGFAEAPPDVEVAAELQDLKGNQLTKDPLEQFERHVRFERLLLAVLKHNYASDKHHKSIRKLVEGTLDYIHEHYKDVLRIENLACSCNISSRHYTRIFTELTDKSPVDYLTELRIRQSVRQLVSSGGKLTDVARGVGYADPDYYSKRFKEKTGMSPSGYMTNWRHSPRIIALQCAGDLFALGIKPFGIMTNGLLGPFRNYMNGVQTLDHAFETVAGTIASMKPDLIVAGDYMSAELIDILSKISPTVTVEWEGIGPFYHLNMLSQILGREKEKRQWLERYELRREEVSRKLAALSQNWPRETAAVFYMWKDEIRVFAPNIFPTFYEVLGYEMPSWFQNWSAEDKRRGSMPVQFEAFLAFAADSIFIIVQDETALETLNRLKMAYKDVLPAITQNKIHSLESDWYSIDATSLYWQLQSVVSHTKQQMPH
ncbi:helix-turn-helix domain-containing protein [Paenibacillus sp. NPDC057967]|uniref:helix-turn-helix domain-containing protein n=1 Tax=Paenibacillus sp. NPDC057967 TaxID=3346293 RepID=UPI0036D777FD